MSKEEHGTMQLCLFPIRLTWQEFPRDVREEISQLLGIMCTDIVQQSSEQETHDESGKHTPLAS